MEIPYQNLGFLCALKRQWEMKIPYQHLCVFYSHKKFNGKSMEIPYQNLWRFSAHKNNGNSMKISIKISVFFAHKNKQWEIHANPLSKSMFCFFFAHKKTTGTSIKVLIKIYGFFNAQKKMGNPWKSSMKISDVFLHIKKNLWEINGNPLSKSMFFFMRLKNQWDILWKKYQNLCFFFHKKWIGKSMEITCQNLYVFFCTKKNQWEIHGNPIKICVVLMRILKNGNPCIKISVFFCALSQQLEIHENPLSKSTICLCAKKQFEMEIPYPNLWVWHFFAHKKTQWEVEISYQNLWFYFVHKKTMGNGNPLSFCFCA